MSPAISSALEGVNQAEEQVNAAAVQIATGRSSTGASTAKPAGSAADSVDMSTSIVSLMEGKTNFAANLKTIHAVDEMDKHLIDLVG